MPESQQVDEPAEMPAVTDLAIVDDPRMQVRLGEIGLIGFAPYLLNRVAGRYDTVLRGRLAAYGLTMPKIRTLAVLSVIERPLIRDLAIYTVTEQSTLSRALDGLVAEGLVRRNQDAQDSRGVRICLTEKGREAFETLWPEMARIYAAMFNGIPEEESRALVITLQKLLANIEALSD